MVKRKNENEEEKELKGRKMFEKNIKYLKEKVKYKKKN